MSRRLKDVGDDKKQFMKRDATKAFAHTFSPTGVNHRALQTELVGFRGEKDGDVTVEARLNNNDAAILLESKQGKNSAAGSPLKKLCSMAATQTDQLAKLHTDVAALNAAVKKIIVQNGKQQGQIEWLMAQNNELTSRLTQLLTQQQGQIEWLMPTQLGRLDPLLIRILKEYVRKDICTVLGKDYNEVKAEWNKFLQQLQAAEFTRLHEELKLSKGDLKATMYDQDQQAGSDESEVAHEADEPGQIAKAIMQMAGGENRSRYEKLFNAHFNKGVYDAYQPGGE